MRDCSRAEWNGGLEKTLYGEISMLRRVQGSILVHCGIVGPGEIRLDLRGEKLGRREREGEGAINRPVTDGVTEGGTLNK